MASTNVNKTTESTIFEIIVGLEKIENMLNVTASIGKKKYQTTLISDGKTMISDEPESAGGEGLGFAPGELLASSLAACTAITVKMYADRKGWLLEEALVDVNYSKEIADELTNFTLNLRLFGELDDKQRERLFEIAKKCPIHKLLTNPIEVHHYLKD